MIGSDRELLNCLGSDICKCAYWLWAVTIAMRGALLDVFDERRRRLNTAR